MITIDNFEVTYTGRGWTLREKYQSKNKDGETVEKFDDTYHASLSQVCDSIIEKKSGLCESLSELQDMLRSAKATLVKKIEEV